MTTLFGNICLLLAALVSSTLIASAFNYKPPIGGSGGVAAYPIWMLLLEFAFLCLITLAAFAIARAGGFDWISPNRLIRYVLVTVGVVSAVYMLAAGSMTMENPGSETAIIQWLSKFVLVFVPVILIASGFVMLNGFIRDLVPVFCYRWPLAIMLCMGVLLLGATVFDYYVKKSEGLGGAQQRYESAENIKASRLVQIQEADIKEDMLRMLEFTGALYPPEVREKASAKIKTHPNWQQELVTYLENDHALEAFNFLAANEVDDKKSFLEPIQKGVFSVADWVRHYIQGTSPSGFYHDLFSDEVNRVLRTVDKFEGMGVDYLPAVRALRSALDEPAAIRKFKYDCVPVLDEWIKKHE